MKNCMNLILNVWNWHADWSNNDMIWYGNECKAMKNNERSHKIVCRKCLIFQMQFCQSNCANSRDDLWRAKPWFYRNLGLEDALRKDINDSW